MFSKRSERRIEYYHQLLKNVLKYLKVIFFDYALFAFLKYVEALINIKLEINTIFFLKNLLLLM